MRPDGVTQTTDRAIAKWEMLINLGPQGWSETYFVSTENLDVSRAVGLTLMQGMVQARRKALNPACQVVGLRMTPWTWNGPPQLWQAPDVSMGPGLGTAGVPASPNHGVLFVLNVSGGGPNARRIIKGWTNADLSGRYNSSGGLSTVGTVVRDWKTDFRRAYTDVVVDKAGRSARFVVPSRARSAAAPTRYYIDSMTLDTNGQLKVKFLANVADITTADLAHIYLTKKKCVRGVSGQHRAISVDRTDSSHTVITFDHHPCCGATGLTGVTGYAVKISEVYANVNDVFYDKYADQKVGRAFFSLAGRRSGKCC